MADLDWYQAHSAALALYDGGWRSEDHDQLITEYTLLEVEADLICTCLADIHREALERVVDEDKN